MKLTEKCENEYLKCLLRLSVGPTIKSKRNQNTHQLAKLNTEKGNSEWPIDYILKTRKNIEFTPQVKKRLKTISSLPLHENLFHLVASGNANESKGRGEILEVSILEEYLFDSQSLEDIIEDVINNKKQLTTNSLNFIFYQVAKAMAFLEEHKLNHLRLNPSSVIIKLPNAQSNENPFVRVDDIGIALQKNYQFPYCLHKDYFNNINPYECQYQQCIKYDLWAFGAMIYFAIKRQRLFQQGIIFNFFPRFNQKYVSVPEEWVFKNGNNVDTKFLLLGRVFVKCWGLHKQAMFQNWSEVIQYFDKECSVTRIEKMPIYDIYVNHIRLIFILIAVSKYIQQKKEKLLSLTKSIEEEVSMGQYLNKISKYLVLIADCYHNIQFDKYFKLRCGALPALDKQRLQKQKELISAAKANLLIWQNVVDKNKLNSLLHDKLYQPLIKLQFLLKGNQKDQTIAKLKEFTQQLLKCCRESEEVNKDSTKDRCEFLSVLYEWQAIKSMADENFGFQIPKFVSLIDL